jgi:hypothetical protein
LSEETYLAPVTQLTDGPLHHFFGYYDKFPWNRSGRYVLAMENSFADHNPTGDDALTLGAIDMQDGNRFRPLAKSSAWNWQQGCMLRWLPPEEEHVFLYNDRRGDRFVTVLYDVRDGSQKEWPWPIYDISNDGRYAASANFARTTSTRPGYGYFGVEDPFAGELAPRDDGLYIVDVPRQHRRMALSLTDAVGLGGIRPEPGYKSWFDHLKFNPSGSRMLFLHRWAAKAVPGHHGFFTRMITIDPDGGRPVVLIEGCGISHFDWYDDETILVWLWTDKGDINDYYLVHDPSGRREHFAPPGTFQVDGHCNYSPDRRWIVTDTYPQGPENKQTLILYDPKVNRRVNVGAFAAIRETDPSWRCDMHPRWSRDGSQLCIDSTHSGLRQMYVVDVSGIAK